jgi:hypothetical protein
VDLQTGQFALSALACTVYVIILLVLVWPLIYPLVRRRWPAGRTGAPPKQPSETGGSKR